MKNKKKQKHFNYSLQEKKSLLEDMMVMERRKGLQEDLKVHRKKKTTFKLQFQGRNKDLWEEIKPSNYGLREEIKVYMKK